MIEQVIARQPTAPEAEQLGITPATPVLALYVTAREASGRPVLVLDIAMPGDRHEDAYQVS